MSAFIRTSLNSGAGYLIIFLFLSSLLNDSLAQSIPGLDYVGRLRGFVTDTANGEAVISANVVIKGTSLGASTDVRGYYFIANIPVGEQTISVSCIGYRTKLLQVKIYSDKIALINIQLQSSELILDDISVIANREVKKNEQTISIDQITLKDIQAIPMGVESDVLRALQNSPSVGSTGDVSGRFYVRGGGSDQNMLLIDNAVLYNPFHALGIFSVVDPEMISLLEFHKGGYTTEYGGRLSSILNIITKDGNKNRFQASATGSFLTAKGSIEGPIPFGSFIVTGRKSYFPQALDKFLNGKHPPFDFWDMSFKVNYSNPEIYENGKFTFHGFISDDKVNNNNPLKEDYSFQNQVFGLNWFQVWASPLFSYMTFTYSTFEGAVIPNHSLTKPRKNVIYDMTSNWDFTYMYDTKDQVVAGFQNKIINTELNMENLYGSYISDSNKGLDMNIYAKYRFLRFETLGIDAGIRFNIIPMTNLRPSLIEPRIAFTYVPYNTLIFKAAYGRYSQTLTTLSNENELITIFEPWIIIPDYLKPSEASHYIAGVQWYMTDRFSLNLEGYYKSISNLTDVNDKKYTSIENDLISVGGEAYGLEFTADYNSADFFLKSSYTFAYAYKINNGVKYFPRYDSRHTVNFLAGINLFSGWQFNVVWQLKTGLPYTPISGFYDRLQIKDFWQQWFLTTPFASATLYGDKNSERLPIYHRMDLSLSKKFKVFFSNITFDLSVINVYNRNNIFYLDKNTGEKVYMLPFLPSASIKVDL